MKGLILKDLLNLKKYIQNAGSNDALFRRCFLTPGKWRYLLG